MKKANTKNEFNSAMIGIILFDGTMPCSNRLYVRHGGKQLSYVDEKVEYLSKYIQPTSLRSSVDKKGFAYRYAYYNSEQLKCLYNAIYCDNSKQLNQKLLNRFNAITFAFMYMDDGCLVLRRDKKNNSIKSREIYLSTHSFSIDEVTRLRNILLKKYDIDFHISYEKGHPRMWCNTKNTIKFLELVAPIVKEFPSMHYKLDLQYKTKDIKFI